MPVVAFLVGQGRVDGRVVEINNFLAWVAFVVFGHGVRNRQSGAGAIALGHVTETLVNRGFERIQAFLRRAFVVKPGNFKLHTRRVFGTAQALGSKLPALELVLPHIGKGPRQRVNKGDLDGLTLLGKRAARAHDKRRRRNKFHSKFHTFHSVSPEFRSKGQAPRILAICLPCDGGFPQAELPMRHASPGMPGCIRLQRGNRSPVGSDGRYTPGSV